MSMHARSLLIAAKDPVIKGILVENGFKLVRKARSDQLTDLCRDHAASVREAGGSISLGRTGQRFIGSVVLANSRAIQSALEHEKRFDDWEAFRQRPLRSYLGHVAELATKYKFPPEMSARSTRFFTETSDGNTFISCSVTDEPNRPNRSYSPIRQLNIERAVTLRAPEEIALPEPSDNDHKTLKVASFRGYAAPADIDSIVNSLNTSAEGLEIAIHLRSLTYLAFLGSQGTPARS